MIHKYLKLLRNALVLFNYSSWAHLINYVFFCGGRCLPAINRKSQSYLVQLRRLVDVCVQECSVEDRQGLHCSVAHLVPGIRYNASNHERNGLQFFSTLFLVPYCLFFEEKVNIKTKGEFHIHIRQGSQKSRTREMIGSSSIIMPWDGML